NLRLVLRDPDSPYITDLSAWLNGTVEVRGWIVRIHGYDVLSDTFDPDLAIGRISKLAHDDLTLDVLCTALTPIRTTDALPAYTITASEFPYAPASGAPAGGLGSPVTHGWGVMRS